MKLAVIGDPVAHSQSPALQEALLREAGIAGTYEAIRVQAGSCGSALQRLAEAGYVGVNVTTPLKEEAYALCDALTHDARRIEAVNTLMFTREGLIGANTDGIGALRSVESALGAPVKGKRILVLGVGPTARAAAWSLHVNGADVRLWNRTKERARPVAEALDVLPWAPGDPAPDLAIATLPPNATLDPDALRVLRAVPLVIDANYGARATLAALLGRKVIDGEAMLAAQARASFEMWRSGVPT